MSQRFPLSKLVECEWTDITSFNDGWMSPAEARKRSTPMLIKTVGYVLEDTQKELKLTMMQATTNDGEVGVSCVIPKSVIKHLKVLRGL